MTKPEEFQAWGKVRELATSIIGFYDLAEAPDTIKNEVHRLTYEAQVYAGGVALARLLVEIAAGASHED